MSKHISDIIRNLALTFIVLVFMQNCWDTVNSSMEKFGPKDERPLLLIPNFPQPSIPPLQKNSLDFSKPDIATNSQKTDF